MTPQRILKQFPELGPFTPEQQQQLFQAAQKDAFGPDLKLERWRGNILNFALMFAVSALFVAWLAPALALSRDLAALFMLVVILPAFFILQQRRYQHLIRRALARQIAARKD